MPAAIAHWRKGCGISAMETALRCSSHCLASPPARLDRLPAAATRTVRPAIRLNCSPRRKSLSNCSAKSLPMCWRRRTRSCSQPRSRRSRTWSAASPASCSRSSASFNSPEEADAQSAVSLVADKDERATIVPSEPGIGSRSTRLGPWARGRMVLDGFYFLASPVPWASSASIVVLLLQNSR